MKQIIFGVLALLLVLSVVSISESEARKAYDVKKPYYTTGNGNIKYKVIIDNDCWKSLYIRSTPKMHNQVLLNYQYVYNNQPTDSEKDYVKSGTLKFKTMKIEQATAEDPKIRVYSTWKLTSHDGDMYEGTDTQYVDYIKGKTTYELPRPFQLHPDVNECRE